MVCNLLACVSHRTARKNFFVHFDTEIDPGWFTNELLTAIIRMRKIAEGRRRIIKHLLSGLIITEICACNRIHLQLGTIGKRENRQRYALAIKTAGRTAYHSGKRTSASDETHVCFLPKGSNYTFECMEEGECLMVEFDGYGADQCREPVSIEVGEIEELSKLFRMMEHALTFRREGYMFECLSRGYRMLSILVEQSTRQYMDQSKSALIAPAIRYIEENLSRSAIPNEELARVCGISCVYFRKLFVQQCKVPPSTYIMALRVRRAKGLLIGDGGTVGDVAQQCGFSSISHFSKAFKRVTGFTPKAYAQMYQQQK